MSRSPYTGRLPGLATAYWMTARSPTTARTAPATARPPATPVYPAVAVAAGRSPREGISARARTVAVCRPGAAGTREVHTTLVMPRIQKLRPPGQRRAAPGTAGSVTVTRWRSAPERLVSVYRLTTVWPRRTPGCSAPRPGRALTVTERRSAPAVPAPSAAARGAVCADRSSAARASGSEPTRNVRPTLMRALLPSDCRGHRGGAPWSASVGAGARRHPDWAGRARMHRDGRRPPAAERGRADAGGRRTTRP
ncbi:hypothetical protein ATE80_18005 [Streptomyces kanasensis]|uniref:Uncharacterized protein n=1 Tax=Streptomyces kanasensis TaxID=936756 RepID=A0A100Y4E5_9ACTN|nr:hypothetical protein ATE80_18005 [Streptomyces kanasensis]